MSAAIAAGVVGTVVGGVIASEGSKSAAKTAASATRDASQAIINETREARKEILDRMVPALKDYGNEMDNLQQYVADGTVDVMKVLSESTGNAMQVIQTAGSNARKALLGSSASASGMPRQQFDQTYRQTESLPPNQQVAALQKAFPNEMGTFESSKIAADSRDRSSGLVEPTAAETTEVTAAPTTASQGRWVPNPKYQTGKGWDPSIPKEIFVKSNTEIGTPGSTSRTITTSGVDDSRPEYAYSSYEDRGTPGFDVDMALNTEGIYAPVEAAPGTGFYGAMDQLTQGEQRSLSTLAQGVGTARQDITAGRDASLARLDPYSSAGRSALDQEAALSGALGPEAQQEAINSFIESPGQQYLRERQEKALLRNTAAIGGLGGGQVRTALMEQAMGIASTQQQQHLENLRSLAGRGQEADTTAAGIEQTAATQLANLADALGVRGANLISMTSQQKAALAESVGIQLADLENAIGSAQAGQLSTLGGQTAAAMSGGLADIATIGNQSATNQLGGQQTIAQLLANLATQQGTQVAGLTAAGGSALAAGQAQAGSTMGQAVKDVGDLSAYALANKAAVTNPTSFTNSNNWAPAGNPTTDLIGPMANQGMSR